MEDYRLLKNKNSDAKKVDEEEIADGRFFIEKQDNLMFYRKAMTLTEIRLKIYKYLHKMKHSDKE